MTEYPRNCEQCQRLGLWESEPVSHRLLCPDCLATFLERWRRWESDQPAFIEWSRSWNRHYSDPQHRERVFEDWRRRGRPGPGQTRGRDFGGQSPEVQN